MELKKQNEELLRLKKRIIQMRDRGKTEEEERIKAIRTKIMKKYGEKLDNKKRDNWKDFAPEFTNMSDSEKLAKILKGSQNNFMQTLIQNQGNTQVLQKRHWNVSLTNTFQKGKNKRQR